MSEEEEMENRVLEALALGVDPVPPPSGLRERILAAAAEAAREEPGGLVPLPRNAIGRRIPVGAVAAAVAIALLAGLLIGRTTTPEPPPAVAHFTISGHGAFQAVTAKVVDLKSEGVALVTFDNLPAPPPGQVYELWLITPGGKADPAGVFVPDAGGGKVVVVGQSLAGYKLMAVTVEAGPDGVGSPTQQPQIYGTVA